MSLELSGIHYINIENHQLSMIGGVCSFLIAGKIWINRKPWILESDSFFGIYEGSNHIPLPIRLRIEIWRIEIQHASQCFTDILGVSVLFMAHVENEHFSFNQD